MVTHTVRVMPKKRQVEDLIAKRKKIGELLGLKKVPLHVLAWQEPKLELGDGDCYPLIDVLERLSQLIPGPKIEKGLFTEIPAKKPGRPKAKK